MTSARHLLVLVLAVVLVAGGIPAASSAGDRAATAAGSAAWTVDRAFDFGEVWGSRCFSDGCGMQIRQFAHIPASRATEGATVVVQLTLDFKTSVDDVGGVYVQLESSAPGLVNMRPGRYALSSARRTSTTLRWVVRDVPASADGYDVVAVISASAAGNGDSSRITSTQATVFVSVEP